MKDFFNYKDKICIVTGASSGIGKATTEMLIELGAKVYALDIRTCDIDGLEKFLECDLSNQFSIDNAFHSLPKKIDCFFGIAGLSGATTDYLTTFNCNYTANMYITLKYLKERMKKGSAIVYVTSTAGLSWRDFKKEQKKVVFAETWEGVEKAIAPLVKIAPATFAYIFAKRCLANFACIQAVEFGKLGIRINNVMPGSTNTGMKDEFEKMAGGKEALLKETGVAHRLAKPEEMAGPIVFLNSDMASFVSGVDFCVDSADACMKILKLKKDREAVPVTNPIVLTVAKKMMKEK